MSVCEVVTGPIWNALRREVGKYKVLKALLLFEDEIDVKKNWSGPKVG